MQVSFYVYAENIDEIIALREALHEMVSGVYDKGALVTADRLTDAVERFKDNPLITQFFR